MQKKTHHIPTFYHVFDSFHSVISVFIALYLILGFLCISGEKSSILRLYESLEKKNVEPSSNVATLRSDDIPSSISPTSGRCDVVAAWLTRFFDIKKKKENDEWKNKGRERDCREKREDDESMDSEIVCTPVFVFSFSNT